jgi:hypothetical protein
MTDLKQRIPWPAKFGAKLLFGALRIDYRTLKRARIVEHGRMEDAAFAREIFEQHVGAPYRDYGGAPAGTLLELGPGDSVATGFLGRAAGFDAVELVDAGRFADLSAPALETLCKSLAAEPLGLAADAPTDVALARLRARGIGYHTAGVASLAALAAGSVNYAFSNTVLQHVFLDDLAPTLQQLGRLQAPGSGCSHSVVFTDHFSGGYVNHRLPRWFMESSLVKRANLYTNCADTATYLRLFDAAGFAVRKLTVDLFDPKEPRQFECTSAAEFAQRAGDRPVLRTIFRMQRR